MERHTALRQRGLFDPPLPAPQLEHTEPEPVPWSFRICAKRGQLHPANMDIRGAENRALRHWVDVLIRTKPEERHKLAPIIHHDPTGFEAWRALRRRAHLEVLLNDTDEHIRQILNREEGEQDGDSNS